MDAASPPQRLYLDVELRAHRSLTKQGALLLIIPVAFANLVFAVFFLILGAPIVPPFLGLDVLAVILALYLNFRAAKAFERVRVSADEITVEKGRPEQSSRVWSSATHFTRVAIADPGLHAVTVELACRGETLMLGADLSPREREAFGRALEQAIDAARRERWPA
jgi:uncharacterized membrane protein